MNLRTWRKDELEIIWLCEGGEPKNVTEWVAYGKGWTFVEFNCRNGACSGACNAACNDLGLGWWNYQHGDGDQSWAMSAERKELHLQGVWISLLITGSLDGCLFYLVLGAFRAFVGLFFSWFGMITQPRLILSGEVEITTYFNFFNKQGHFVFYSCRTR